ncbi:PLP-dependent aminotransferase family protein [Labrys okinawensis]|uniref:rhizopine catabolism transcriptional regulator MocR n=1 Tax=Labrys okinawensis TaxID=346911 RepID=UPI0039BC9289
MSRRTFPLDALALDRTSRAPLHRQLYLALKTLIQERTLPPETALPSTRSLAHDLRIARNTVSAAYDQLVTEGYLANRAGARPLVIDLPAVPLAASPGSAREAHYPLSCRGDLMMRQPFHYGSPGHMAFHPGMPDASNFPFGLWSRLLARRASFARDTLFGTYNVTGHPDLRNAIAAYLKTARGVRCSPEQIVVTTGAQAGLDLLARILLDPGDSVWMEEPGYYGAQSAFIAAGARLLPLAVEGGDWQLDPPADKRLRLIYVTPSCHHPLGGTMRMEQRLRLLEIAENRKAWIIEDDFDGEYRFQGQPVPAMQGFDHAQRVIYVGTFAKILFPALRLGFMVLPPSLQEGIVHAVSITGQFAPLLLQAALADFIDQGHMARHLRRMRRIYASRRHYFHELCGAHLGDWLNLASGDAGIQLTAFLREGLADTAVAEAARRRNVNLSPLSMHYRHGAPRQGLVMGYAASDASATRRGILTLRETFEACRA